LQADQLCGERSYPIEWVTTQAHKIAECMNNAGLL
jgi:hypothetical protein